MQDVRESIEKLLISDCEKIKKMDIGDERNKMMNSFTSLYSEYNKDWKDEWDVQLQKERRDFDAEKFEFEKEKFEFEKSKAESEIAQAAADRKVRFFEKLLGVGDTGIRVVSMFFETRANMIFENEGKINKSIEKTLQRHKLL